MWDKLKGLIIEDDAPATAAVPTQPVRTVQVSAAGIPTVVADNEFVQVLRNAIKGRQTAFTALLAAADKLAAVVPDPTQRLKAAFTMVQGDGRGVKEVLEAVEIHMADLTSQERQFDQAMERQKTTAVGIMQSELTNLQQSGPNIAQQIQQLQQQIHALNEQASRNAARSNELTAAISQEEQKLGFAKQKFATAMTIVQGELNGQKMTITSTLTA
jgi:chromosome segregation ATPase